jgi:hypothetical protein
VAKVIVLLLIQLGLLILLFLLFTERQRQHKILMQEIQKQLKALEKIEAELRVGWH